MTAPEVGRSAESAQPRPHHWMNADGQCHAGELFEAGTPAMPLYSADELVRLLNAEKAEAWDQAVRETHDLGWLHDFARSDALARNPYRNPPGETTSTEEATS